MPYSYMKSAGNKDGVANGLAFMVTVENAFK